MTSLTVAGVTLAYGDITILADVSLEVRLGEIVALLGSNGAGKSTLLRGIAGLLPLAHGTVALGEQRIEGLPTHAIVARGLSLVPETRELFGALTTRENLRLGAHSLDRGRGWLHRLDEVLGIFPHLRARLSTRAARLSGGEQQMLALARALMARPRVLCLDDPFLGLSGAVCEDLDAAIRRLSGDGIAVLAAGQHVRRLMALCDRAYVLADGRVAFSGRRAELDDRLLTRALVL